MGVAGFFMRLAAVIGVGVFAWFIAYGLPLLLGRLRGAMRRDASSAQAPGNTPMEQ